MRALVIILGLSVAGCNTSLHHDPVYSVDPILQPYVDEFLSEAAAQGKPMHVDDLYAHFTTTLDGSTDGECYFGSADVTPRVLINYDNWYHYSTASQDKVVMFHELGHCLLNRQHVADEITLPDGEYGPKSIMYPYIVVGSTYTNNWAYYMHEMFYGF